MCVFCAVAYNADNFSALLPTTRKSALISVHVCTVKKLCEIPMWTTVARTKRRGGRKIPTSPSFGSAPPLLTSEFGAFRHGFFTVCYSALLPTTPILFPHCGPQRAKMIGVVNYTAEKILSLMTTTRNNV
jgi:hypothetical protein